MSVRQNTVGSFHATELYAVLEKNGFIKSPHIFPLKKTQLLVLPEHSYAQSFNEGS